MNTPSQLPAVVILTRAGDWDEPGAMEADIVLSLQDVGYNLFVFHDPVESLQALDTFRTPAVVIADWQAFGIYSKEDFGKASLYNPFWEWRSALEDQRASGKILGLIAVYHRNAIGTLDWFGAPRAISSDMILSYPFILKELNLFLQRVIKNPQTERFDIWDDRRKS